VKKFLFLSAILTITIAAFAQDSTSRDRSPKQEKRREKREKINSMIRKDEEGELAYHKQSVFGIQLRTMGYGLLYELGRMKTTRKTTTYGLEISEIKLSKEDKLPKGTFTFSNPYIFGKINNFYQFKLGIGQQYLLGDKGNRNGVSVSAIYGGGLSLGFLRPYYLEVQDQGGNVQTIKYSQDSALFVGGLIVGGGGLGKGWGEMELRPGAYAKAGLRFDYGRFNEIVSAIEIGVSLDAYLKEVPIMLSSRTKNCSSRAM
jgi:hypothetical protein